MRVFVTGGSGFIGTAFVRALVAAGHAVSALARRPERAPPIAGVDWIGGDLAQPNGLDLALAPLANADAVVHLAAVRKDWGMTGVELNRVNVAAGPAVLDRATAAKRILFVSSVAVYGHSLGEPTTERSAFRPSKRYGVSKVEAEVALGRAAAAREVPLTIVRPGVVYGPGDTYGMVANLARLVARKRFARVGSGRSRLNFLYIDDLAAALVQALTTPAAAGEDFIFAGPEPVAIRRLIELVTEATAGWVPPIAVPEFVARVAARQLELGWRLLGRTDEPFLTKSKVDLFTRDDLYDTRKARDLLGFRPTVGLTEGLARAVAWMRETGQR